MAPSRGLRQEMIEHMNRDILALIHENMDTFSKGAKSGLPTIFWNPMTKPPL